MNTALAKSRIYSAAPVAIQHIMVSAYGAQLRHLRYGGEHRAYLAGLQLREWDAPDVVDQTQLQTLNRLLRHARATVPFYRDRLPDCDLPDLAALVSLPVVTKHEVRAAGCGLVSQLYARDGLMEIHTGGTTGTPLTIYCDRAALRRNYAFFVRFQSAAGIPARSPVATFAGRTIVPVSQRRPPFWRHNVAGNALLCSSYHLEPETIGAYAGALERFQPAWIDSYPSSLEPIARWLVAHPETEVRPRAVITSSETLLPHTRQLLADAFHAPVFDHYGAAEMAAFITQCRAGSYHCNPEYGIVEVLRDGVPVEPGETGEIVATGFVNPVMPFIRYATGDLGVRGDGPCLCGRSSPTLKRIVGRMDDVLVTPEGRHVGRLDPIFKAVSSLVETRIVQDSLDHVRVEMVCEAPLEERERATLLHELRQRLGDSMRIDFVRVSRLEREASGKLRAVSNLAMPSPTVYPVMDARWTTHRAIRTDQPAIPD